MKQLKQPLWVIATRMGEVPFGLRNLLS